MDEAIREILRVHGGLPGDVTALGVDEDLYRAGLTSHASVNVMLALEDAYDIEFPDALLRRATFESIGSITAALESLGVTGSARTQ